MGAGGARHLVYGFFVGVAVYRNLGWLDLYEIFRDAAVSSAVVMIVVAFAGLFSWTGSTLGVMDRFGVMMTVNLAIGTITPPVARVPMEEVSRWVVPFFLALLGALLLVVYIPGLSLWLPNALGVR